MDNDYIERFFLLFRVDCCYKTVHDLVSALLRNHSLIDMLWEQTSEASAAAADDWSSDEREAVSFPENVLFRSYPANGFLHLIGFPPRIVRFRLRTRFCLLWDLQYFIIMI